MKGAARAGSAPRSLSSEASAPERRVSLSAWVHCLPIVVGDLLHRLTRVFHIILTLQSDQKTIRAFCYFWIPRWKKLKAIFMMQASFYKYIITW